MKQRSHVNAQTQMTDTRIGKLDARAEGTFLVGDALLLAEKKRL